MMIRLPGFLLLIGILSLSCTQIPHMAEDMEGVEYRDGIYEGEYMQTLVGAKVEVTIRDGRIAEIRYEEYKAGRDRDARTIIPERIIEAQSPNVEIVTGATGSSKVIMNAVQMALEKAVIK